MLTEEVPKITDWMQAWGSVVSVAVSTGALVFTGLLLRQEMRTARLATERANEERRDAEASQARLVVAVPKRAWGETNPTTGASEGPIRLVGWRLENHSGQPVFDVDARFRIVGLDSVWTDGASLAIATEQMTWMEAVFDPPMGIDSSTFDCRQLSVEIRFTDIDGLRWSRVDRAHPRRVLDQDPTAVH